MRYNEIHPVGHGRAPHSGRHGPIYYVIPGGVSVIFQDEYGNEVGSGRPAPRSAPFVVQDNHGRELYSYDGRDHESGHPRDPRVVMIDPNQRGSKRPSSSRGYSSQNYHSDPSYRHHDDYSSHRYHSGPSYRHYDDYYHEHRGRGYRDRDDRDPYREREYRDPYRDREYRDREYRGMIGSPRTNHEDRTHQCTEQTATAAILPRICPKGHFHRLFRMTGIPIPAGCVTGLIPRHAPRRGAR
ncbi:hypothetical protein EV424DRAFT_1013978 [Suillus variegatus]|nr:hypothetical protein EV424DRAFT_1013978 [Suillus variegatus]